jgi:hypothetical protein
METLWTCQVKDKCKTTMLEKSLVKNQTKTTKQQQKLQNEINN